MLKRFAVLAFLVLSACPPEADDKCSPENSLVCDSATVALFCEDGRLREIECRGPGGCVQGLDKGVCDLTRGRAGDACPKQSENQAQCDVGDPNRALVCKNGIWTAQACNTCASQGGNIVCR